MRERGRPRAGESHLVEKEMTKYWFSGVRWAGIHWIFSDGRQRLRCMVNDVITELMDLDMEPKTRISVVGEHVESRRGIDIIIGREREQMEDTVR